MRVVFGIVLALLLGVAVGACSSSSVGEELFVAGFESGDLTEWDHSQAISERIEIVGDGAAEGELAGRFEVRGGDEEPGTGAQRAEVVSGVEYEEGDVRYFRILARIESWDHDHWGMIWQLHDDGSGSPPLSLQQEVDEAEQVLRLSTGDATDIYWEGELPEQGEWFEIVIRVEFGESGSLRVWLNGEEDEIANGETVLEDVDTLGDPPAYDKLGVYRSSSAEDTAVVLYDGYRVSSDFFSDPPG